MMAKEVRVNKLTLAVLIALGVLVIVYVISTSHTGKMGSREEVESVVRLSELISASIDLAERAGTRVKEVRDMDDTQIGKLSKGVTKEGKKEYVTLGDQVKLIIMVPAKEIRETT